MKRLAERIMAHRRKILAAALLLCALCAYLAARVPINADMTKYLPGSSRMKQGIDRLQEEFSALSFPYTIRVMAKDLAPEEKETLERALQGIEYVGSAALTQEKEAYTLYTVSTQYPYGSAKEREIENSIRAMAQSGLDLTVQNDQTTGMDIPPLVFVLAVGILLLILFIMCGSWAEPFLFLAAIGIAILLNMGTNLVLGSVSQTTYSMSAILQLVLSMDYSIILMNRYRHQKKETEEAGGAGRMGDGGESFAEREGIMALAWQKAFSSIAGSGMTTLAGLLMLVFMRFKIGRDLGLVLAKGVFLSMVCVLTVLPALIVQFDGLIARTKKGVPRIPVKGLTRFGYRARYALASFFPLLFLGCGYLQTRSQTSFALEADDAIAAVFPPENTIVLLYANAQENAAAQLSDQLEEEEREMQVFSWAATLGKQRTAEELAAYIVEMGGPEEFTTEDIRRAYSLYGLLHGRSGQDAPKTLSIEELFSLAQENAGNPLLGALLGDGWSARIEQMGGMIEEAKAQLIGPEHSLLILRTHLPVEGKETERFLEKLDRYGEQKLGGEYYLIGNSPMAREMKRGFAREFLTISLLTAGAVFLVVALTFRQLMLPLILVLLVQCGVFMTVMTTWLLGYRIYYLAVIIVQCILMGATVDYGILFSGIYREMRSCAAVEQALQLALERSIHTILTSSLFMICVTGAIGFSPVESTIAQICRTIALGGLSALVLVLLMLPGLLAAFDRYVAGAGEKGLYERER